MVNPKFKAVFSCAYSSTYTHYTIKCCYKESFFVAANKNFIPGLFLLQMLPVDAEWVSRTPACRVPSGSDLLSQVLKVFSKSNPFS